MANRRRNNFAQNQPFLAKKPPFLVEKPDFLAIFGPLFRAVNADSVTGSRFPGVGSSG
jgi:hypothetical protein